MKCMKREGELWRGVDRERESERGERDRQTEVRERERGSMMKDEVEGKGGDGDVRR